MYDGDCRPAAMSGWSDCNEAVDPVKLVNAERNRPLVEEARRARFRPRCRYGAEDGRKALLRRRLSRNGWLLSTPSVVQSDQPGHPGAAHRGADPVPDLAVGPQPDAASAHCSKDARCALGARRRPAACSRRGLMRSLISPSRRANVSLGPGTSGFRRDRLVLGLQVISIITWSGRYTWPFTGYPMYARSAGGGSGRRSPHPLRRARRWSGDRDYPDDLGGNVFVFQKWIGALQLERPGLQVSSDDRQAANKRLTDNRQSGHFETG